MVAFGRHLIDRHRKPSGSMSTLARKTSGSVICNRTCDQATRNNIVAACLLAMNRLDGIKLLSITILVIKCGRLDLLLESSSPSAEKVPSLMVVPPTSILIRIP